MKEIVFATHNEHKLAEVRGIVGAGIKILGLSDIDCHNDMPETGATFEENALQKAKYVKEKYGYDCFAEDSGLEVDSLNQKPGVHTARYAGPNATSDDNMDKLLSSLKGVSNRSARFRTVIALIENGNHHFFDGKIEGTIPESRMGEGGFGYDPVFVPQGYSSSFAQLGVDIKNKISHRAIATQKFIDFLNR